MSITDELREYVGNFYLFRYKDVREKLNEIADRIDAEHKKACDDAWDNGYEADYLGIEKWLTEHPQVMEHHGWVRLPVDADGIPIHVGDVMDEQLPFGGYAAPAPVDTMELSRGAGGYGWMVRLDSESGAFINPKLLRHHHAPTVEDVLREFAAEVETAGGVMELHDATLAEYAARLRLAGEDA